MTSASLQARDCPVTGQVPLSPLLSTERNPLASEREARAASQASTAARGGASARNNTLSLSFRQRCLPRASCPRGQLEMSPQFQTPSSATVNIPLPETPLLAPAVPDPASASLAGDLGTVLCAASLLLAVGRSPGEATPGPSLRLQRHLKAGAAARGGKSCTRSCRSPDRPRRAAGQGANSPTFSGSLTPTVSSNLSSCSSSSSCSEEAHEVSKLKPVSQASNHPRPRMAQGVCHAAKESLALGLAKAIL